MRDYLKKLWPYLAIFACFVIMACTYMSPELQGEKIGANDNIQAISAMGEELNYTAQTGKQSWWNGAMFCGMPNYQIGGADYESTKWLSPLMKVFRSGYGSPICLLLLYLVCFYTLMLSMKMGKWLSIVGAIALTFSSYFMIIIGTSHVTKATSIALMTLALAGFYLIFHNYRKTGICLCMIGTATGFAPHPQMTYYICFLFAAFGIAELWSAFRSKAWKSFALNSVLSLVSLGIGVGTSVANTFANMEYVKESTRGGDSELIEHKPGEKSSTGLDYKYATEYSYGVDESLTLLIPNYKGGSSTYRLGLSDGEINRMVSDGINEGEARAFSAMARTYWGDQAITEGPVYMGAIIIFLFVLGLFILRGPYKWALLGVTLFSLILSWGYHFESFNHFFFDYFPLFNKFRAVSSILIIAEIAVPILAVMTVREVMTITGSQQAAASRQPAGRKQKTNVKKQSAETLRLRKHILISAGITAGICILALLYATMFEPFHSATESLTQGSDGQKKYLSELIYYRKYLLHNDIWRSIGLVAAAALLLLTYLYGKIQKAWFTAVLGVLVLFDMWSVDKRYINDSRFCTPDDYSAQFDMQPWEEKILDADTSPSYRVVNWSDNQKWAARTSFRLKSVLGYHAAKLRRYDDILNEHLAKGHMPVFNMLNAKYAIKDTGTQDSLAVFINRAAMGNAWFVDTLRLANTAREECDGLMKYDLHRNAIVGKDFVSHVKDMTPGSDSCASVMMTKYEPDCVYYTAQCSKPGTIVFSEIYYPYGWKAYIDDKPVEHYRVNYVLRALNIDPGNHRIRFEFRPESVERGDSIAKVCVIIMYITLAVCPMWWLAEQAVVYRRRKNESR